MVLDLLYVGGVTYGLWMLGNCVEIVRKRPFSIILGLLYTGFGAGGNLVENGRFRLTICLPFEGSGNGEWGKSLFWAY